MHLRSTFRRAAVAGAITALAVGAMAITTTGASASRNTQHSASNPYNLIHPGTLTVGMDLVFKPEMYLNAAGKPAGYDVTLLHLLVKAMHVKLHIVNLDFTGLIPGLQAKKFDMVSVGLSPTPARAKVVTFSRAYVPYALILAEATTSKISATISAWNSSSVTLTALEGSTDAQLAKSTFPKASLQTFADDTTALLQVATHRAQGAVIEDYILAQFQKSNPGELKAVPFSKPLNVQYGSYAVHKGNSPLVKYLNTWLCKEQNSGGLAGAYKSTEGVSTFPPMPAC